MIYSFFPNYFHSGETRLLLIFIDFDEILYLKGNRLRLDYKEGILFFKKPTDTKSNLTLSPYDPQREVDL